MHKVTPEQMDQILHSMKTEGKDAGTIFQSLGLNPYDYHENGGKLEFNVVVYESRITERIEEVQNYPEDLTDYSEERIAELKAGSKLTDEELEGWRELFIESEQKEEFAEYAVVSELTDSKRSVYTLYFEQVWGQGGLHINEFFGFFETEDEARKEMNNVEGVIIA